MRLTLEHIEGPIRVGMHFLWHPSNSAMREHVVVRSVHFGRLIRNLIAVRADGMPLPPSAYVLNSGALCNDEEVFRDFVAPCDEDGRELPRDTPGRTGRRVWLALHPCKGGPRPVFYVTVREWATPDHVLSFERFSASTDDEVRCPWCLVPLTPADVQVQPDLVEINSE